MRDPEAGQPTRRRFVSTLLAGGAVLAGGWHRLAWAAHGSRKGRVRLLFFTDVHARRDLGVPQALERATRRMKGRRADLIIAGGDLIHGGMELCEGEAKARWDLYMTMHQGIGSEVRAAVGNQDLVAVAPEGCAPSRDPRAMLRARLGLERTFYSFDALGYHFMIVDSVHLTGDELVYEGRIGAEQLEWIEEDLSRVAPSRPIVLVTHLPLVTAFFTVSEGATVGARKDRVVVNNRQVLEMFAERNLLLVLQGHLHVRELVRWRNTRFLTGGAISGRWWRGPRLGTEEGFYVLTLEQDRIECEYVDYGWEVPRADGDGSGKEEGRRASRAARYRTPARHSRA